MRTFFRLCLYTGLLIIGCIGVQGCIFRHHQEVFSPENASDINRVFDPKRLSEGGTLFIIPFKAGVGVAATDELEKTALMFIRGFKEVLSQGTYPMDMITTLGTNSPDFIGRGHVIKFHESKAWPWGKKVLILEIRGQIVDNRTKRVLAAFDWEKSVHGRAIDSRKLGFDIGQEVARFILKRLN